MMQQNERPPKQPYGSKEPAVPTTTTAPTRPTMLELSVDGREFIGRYEIEKIGHCVDKTDFWREVGRINSAYTRAFQHHRQSKFAKAVAPVCIPLGILLIGLSLQEEAWPFFLAGAIISGAGFFGSALFRSRLGMVFGIFGLCLVIVPLGGGHSWVLVANGSLMSILGVMGLMAFASRKGDKSFRAATLFLPIGVALIIIGMNGDGDSDDKSYRWAFLVGGIGLVIGGIVGLFSQLGKDEERLKEALRIIHMVIDQLNRRYEGVLIWTLIEAEEIETKKRRRGGRKHGRKMPVMDSLMIEVKGHPNREEFREEFLRSLKKKNQPQNNGQPAVINVNMAPQQQQQPMPAQQQQYQQMPPQQQQYQQMPPQQQQQQYRQY